MDVLTESIIAAFDSNADIVWTTEGANKAIASFVINDAKVTTTFEYTEASAWQVSFDVVAPESSAIQIVHSSIQIFGGVCHSVREFLVARQPERLVFANSEEVMGQLFEAYLERQDTELAALGYEMLPTPLAEFAIQKKTPSAWRQI